MQTLPQPGSSESEARAVSAILARANPAEMPAMRASLSFLTSAGAEMANALAKRNQEYDDLKAIIAALPPEWIQAARTGTSLPDFGSLRAELELAKDERIDLNGQLVERDRLISALQEQLGQAPAPSAEAPSQESAVSADEVAQLNAQIDALRGEMETAALARVQAEEGLRASEAELGDFENRLVDLREELAAALPEDIQAELPAAPVNGQAQDTRQRRAARLGALAAAISALIDRNRQNDEGLQAANTRMAAAIEDFEVVSADRMALEADLQEKVQTLEDQQAQIDRLQSHQETLSLQIEQQTEQIIALQAELDSAQAAKAQVEEQLQLSEGELAELHQQVDSVAQQLRDVLPEEVIAQLTVDDAEAAELSDEALAEGGDEALATRSAAPRMLGLGALAAGVAAAVDLSKEKSGQADQASEQLTLAMDQRAELENALGERELALTDLHAQIEALQAQSADAQTQLDAALAARVELEQQLSQRAGQVSELESQIQDAASRLQEFIPLEDLPQIEATVAEDGGTAAEGEATAGEETGGVKAAGLTALVAGVATMVERNAGHQADLAAQFESMQAQIDSLGQDRLSLEGLLQQKEQDLSGYNDYSLNLQGQVNELSSRAMSVETALALKEQAFDEAQVQSTALATQIDELNAQVADLQGQLDAAASAQAELQGQLEAAVSAKAELDQTLNASQEQLAAAQAELAQIDEESQRSLGEKAVRLGAVGAGTAAVAAIQDKEAELAAANEQLQALQAQLDGLAAERDHLAEGAETLQTDLHSREAELTELHAQMETLQEQAAKAVEERAALQEHLAEVQEDLSEVEQLRSAALSFGNAVALSDTLTQLPAIKKHAITAAIVAGVQPTLSPRVQTLNDVKGIGSAYQQRLYNAGIGTYWELASAPDADLETILEIPELQRARIDFELTRTDAYEWAKLTDSVGLLWDGDHVDDFEQLAGIGRTFEKRLYEAGITTYEQLAECDVERLAEIIKPPPMREVHYDEWQEAARQLLAAREAAQPAG